MKKQEILKRIESILKKIDDEMVLKDIYNLICGVYKHYLSGNWER